MAPGVLYYPYPEPPVASADHVHQRWNQHQNFWRAMTFRKPNPALIPNHPDADILDYINHYVIEVEVPGVKDVSTLKIQWLDNQTLVVKGETEQQKEPKPTENGSKVQDRNKDENDDEKEDGNDDKKAKVRHWHDSPSLPYLVIGERRLGPFERRFTFPANTVEQDNVKAKLEAGLLTLNIPKHHLHLAKGNKTVHIETSE